MICMSGSKIRKLCGCGKPTQHHGKNSKGEDTYKSSCNACRDKARKMKKSYCEKCGATEKLEIDHIDGNRSNNVPQNIQTLCSKCHIEKGKLNKDWMKKNEKMLQMQN